MRGGDFYGSLVLYVVPFSTSTLIHGSRAFLGSSAVRRRGRCQPHAAVSLFALENEASKRAKALHTKPWPPDRALSERLSALRDP